MKVFTKRKGVSAMAMGIALATGAVTMTGAFGTAAPAYAQKASYSKEFVAAYQPLNEAANAEGADIAALKPQMLAVADAAQSPDEKNAAGGMIFTAGQKTRDAELQLKGMELMLASGKVAVENRGRYNFIVYQLANQQQDFAKARAYLSNAINLNFSTQGAGPNELQVALAETYFSENLFKQGLATLKQAIATREQAGQQVDQAWYRRGLSIAYNNEILPEAYDFNIGWISAYPSEANWRDAINLTRNLNEFESPEMLDLLRLSDKVGTLKNKQDVIYYVETADARRLPLEVKNLIEGHFSADATARDDIYLSDQLKVARDRIPQDRPELGELEAEADETTTDAKLVMAAGDAFYSYSEYDKAERFFAKASTMAGAETQVALTRLGMAQIALGKYDEAKASLGKVTGVRASIAGLWAAYADDMANGG